MKKIYLNLALLICSVVAHAQTISFADILKASVLKDTVKFQAFAKQKGFFYTGTGPAIGYVYITNCKKPAPVTDGKGNTINDFAEPDYIVTYGYPEIDYTVRDKKIYDDMVAEFKECRL